MSVLVRQQKDSSVTRCAICGEEFQHLSDIWKCTYSGDSVCIRHRFDSDSVEARLIRQFSKDQLP